MKNTKFAVFAMFFLVAMLVLSSFAIALADTKTVNSDTSDRGSVVSGTNIGTKITIDDRPAATDTSSGSSTRKTNSVDVNILTISERSEKAYFERKLEIDKTQDIEPETLRKFIQRKRESRKNMEAIVEIAKDRDENRRVQTVENLLSFRQTFVEKLEEQASNDQATRDNINQQIARYSDVVENNKTVEVNISDEKIKSLFENQNPDEFIASLLEQ